jgi:glycosyltransferase involved in cell wall biosynthesis
MRRTVPDYCYHQVLVTHELGGAGLLALHLAAELQGQGRTSLVWLPGEGPAWEKAAGLGLTIRRYDAARVFQGGRLSAALGNWDLGRGLRRHGPGLVHVHGPFHYGALQWGLRLSGLKRVVHVHLEEQEAGLRWAFRRPPDLIVTCARFLEEHVRRTLPARHQTQQRVRALPNPVATERFYPPGDKAEAKKRVDAPAAKPLVLMLANLAPHKGQETVVRAIALLKERGVEVACWLAGVERGGGGSFTARLQALIGELGVQDRVTLLGFRQDAPDLLRAADFLLLPSTCEGLPLTVLEAQATRVPVLAAPTAGIPEVVADGDTGFLIPADDPAGYAQGLERLLGDTGLYHGIAERAYVRTTRAHDWHGYIERIWELYEELRESSAGKQPLRLAGSRRRPLGAVAFGSRLNGEPPIP